MVDNSRTLQMIANDECINDCDNCPLFIKNRKECFRETDRKWEAWAKERSIKFQEHMRTYNG